MDLEKLETLKLYRGATSVIELDFMGFKFEDNSICQFTIQKKYNDDIIFQHDFKKSIKYYVTFRDEFTVGLEDNDYKYDIMYMLKNERYPQCSISDVIIDEVLNDYKGEFDAKAVQVTEVLAEGVEITQSIKVTNSNVIITSSNLQERTITPTKEEQVILAEEGFDGMAKVVVEAIPDKYIIPNLQEKEARVTAPTNIFVHPDEDYDGLAFVNVIATVDVERVEVTPTKEEQVLTPSEKTYFDSVTVNPIPDNYIEPSGELEITENGSYDVIDKASVNVDIQPNLGTKTITENGTYNASDEGLDGYLSVKVETSGADLIEYYTEKISGGSSLKGGWQNTIKKLPNFEIEGTICSYMFLEYPASILDVSSLDTTDATNMGAMFSGCKNVTELDVSNFDTSQVTNMNSMFLNCESLQKINIKKFDTSQVTSFGKMFQYCKSLTELDLSDLNTSLVNNMSYMFQGATSLVTLNMNNLDLSKVTNVSYMFSSASKLTNLQFGNNLGKAYNLQSTGYSNYKLDLSACVNLTHESLMSVINGLYDLNLTFDVANGGTLYKQILVLGATNLAKLTEEEIAIATNKGWTVS